MHTEFALHGTPAVFSSSTAAYLIEPAGEDGGRTRDLRKLLVRLGATVLICGDHDSPDLAFAPVPALARPLVSVVPMQRLVSAVANRVGSSPDQTHMEAEPWAGAISSVTL